MSGDVAKLAYSVEEAAFSANLGRDAIYQAIRDGRLEAKKEGRRTIITAVALQRFLHELPCLRLPGG